jgi:hypothetical protein
MRDPLLDVLAIEFPQPATVEDLERARQRWRRIRLGRGRPEASRPFLLITPLGMPLREQLAQALAAARITIADRTAIHDWPTASTQVYARTDDDERLRVALAFEQLWRSISLSQDAERWDLADASDLGRLVGLKDALHQQLGTVRFRLSVPGVTLRTPHQAVRLHAFHVPDPHAFAAESQVLDALRDEG